MKIDDLLLEKLARWRPNSQHDALEIAHPDSGWAVALVAETVDALAGKWWEARLTRTAPLPEPAPLRARAEGLAARVTGLLEPLRLVEVDSGHGTAQLRSTAPSQRGDDRLHYEVLLQNDGTTTVRRFEAPRAANRRQVAFTLTHEALAKLVRDLTA